MRKLHPNMPADMAMQARNLCRDRIDLLRSRLNLLKGKDRLLLTLYLENGASFRQMAQLTGVKDTIIARRIHNLVRRLADGRYIACLRNRSRLTEGELAIARERFLVGLSTKTIAQKYRLTEYRVGKTIKHILEIIGTI